MIVSNSIKDLMLTRIEVEKAKEFTSTHKCPWYRRLFRRTPPKYVYRQDSTGIGIWSEVSCSRCGANVNITDYNVW